MYRIDHITQENGRWFVEINENGIKEHSGNLWGWDGMTYNSLRAILKKYYNIVIPPIKELTLIKRTVNRKIYTLGR